MQQNYKSKLQLSWAKLSISWVSYKSQNALKMKFRILVKKHFYGGLWVKSANIIGSPHFGHVVEYCLDFISKSTKSWNISSYFFTYFLFVCCLLALCNFCANFLNMYTPSPSFILKSFNLTLDGPKINPLSILVAKISPSPSFIPAWGWGGYISSFSRTATRPADHPE